MDDGVLVLRKKGKNNHSSFPFSHQLLKAEFKLQMQRNSY